jgi:predicted NAD/FAD-binding protein
MAGPSRREVLRGLAGALGAAAVACGDGAGGGDGGAGGGDADAAPPGRKRVGIIGGGAAGVFTAWLLDGAYEVVLFESRDAVGGNVRTVELDVRGQAVPVDVGAQYFGPGPYPTYVALLEMLGLYGPGTTTTHEGPATITIGWDGEATPRFVSPYLPDRDWPLRESWNAPGIGTFAQLSLQGKRFEDADGDWQLPLEDWLAGLPLSVEQREGIALPWFAAVYSGDIEQARGYSARSALIFLTRSLRSGSFTDVTYQTLVPGMGEVLRRLVAASADLTVHTGAAVERVTREGERLRVEAGGRTELVDALVVAAPPKEAAPILADVPGVEGAVAALGMFEFHVAELTLHRDPTYAAPDPRHWSFFNAAALGQYCETSMQLGVMLAPAPDGQPIDVWKSWTTHRDRQPAEVLHNTRFHHMLPTPATIRAQEALRAQQGAGGMWFAGSYTLPFEAQETALLSAMHVAEGLAPASANLAALKARLG